jgi:hypothetical protein
VVLVDESKEDTPAVKKDIRKSRPCGPLRRAESGTRAATSAANMEAGNRRSTFGKRSIRLSELRELRQLREENAKLEPLGRESFAGAYLPGDLSRRRRRGPNAFRRARSVRPQRPGYTMEGSRLEHRSRRLMRKTILQVHAYRYRHPGMRFMRRVPGLAEREAPSPLR